MNDSPLIMTFDFGTQSVRVSVFDKEGNCLAQEGKKYQPAYYSPKPGYAEMDPAYYFDCLCECAKRISEEKPELMRRVAGIELDCFRDSAVLLDKDHNVIRPMILWLDSRMAECKEPLPFLPRTIFKLVGKSEVISLNRRRTMANWVKENEPENYAKIDKYVSISTYFIYRLTGNLKDSPSDFTGHYPLDYKKKQWYANPPKHLQGQIFSLRRDQLVELVDTQGVLGEISKEASALTGIPEGIKIFAGGSDKSCETLGSGVYDDTMASVSLGTACTIETVIKKYMGPRPLLPAYPSVQKDVYNLDVQIYRGFWMINWFLKEFGACRIDDLVTDQFQPAELDKQLDNIAPGSDGLIVQPYWGSPLEHPEVKGAMVGFSDYTTRLHVYKAIIEGIGYELRLSKEIFEKRIKHPFKAIRISGGGAQSDEVCQIYADLFGLPVERLHTIETSSLGAAIGGFLSLGVYKDAKEAVSNMVRVTKRFEPRKEKTEAYDKLYGGAYKDLYRSLKKIYRFIYRYAAV
ncbi:MAG: FGGY-family carbohydrate kinase [Bacilli bacterium]|nr:FGGY-family carbohydrate kinase [Bacilli bacterium]